MCEVKLEANITYTVLDNLPDIHIINTGERKRGTLKFLQVCDSK